MAAGALRRVSMRNAIKKSAIGIDLGCTNIKAVLIDESGNVLEQARQETNEQNDTLWKKAVKELITDLNKRGEKIAAIGLCAPGLANRDNTAIQFMPGRLPGLENFDWTNFTNEKVAVLNDAHAALTAEASFGAAKGMRNALLITLGSGVGGGILINGSLYQGSGQMAGHFGHTTVESNSVLRDVTNMPGSIEDAIGNITISARSCGRFNTTFELIGAYKEGDSFATWLWLDSVRKLAISIASSINLLAPEAVVLGGGIAQAGEALMKPLTGFLELYEWRPGGKQTPLKFAQFSDLAGAIGAAGFALSKTVTAT
jgi:glucokinase